jgi:excisionase family DNA binding protein
MDLKATLSVKEVSELTGWNRATIRSLIKTGKLPAANVSAGTQRARYRISRADIEALLSPVNQGDRS